MLSSLLRTALLGFFVAGCTPSVSIPCASSSQCPAGDTCSAAGICEVKAESLADGFIEVIAGGAIGDEGPAEESILRGVDAVAVDADGSIYVGENSRGFIRKIDIDGTITTVAGTGVQGASVNLPRAALDTNVAPGDFAIFDGYLYFTDTVGERVVRMDLATGIIEFVASGFSDPQGIAIDEAGNIYVGDYTAHRVRRISADTGSVSTFAGTGTGSPPDGNGGVATVANINGPWGVAVDSENLYISTIFGDRIRRVNLETRIISTYAGTGSESFSGDDGPATSAAIYGPRHLAFDSAGNLLIAGYNNGRIRKVNKADGIITTIAGGNACCFIADGVAADESYLPSPSGFAVAADDTIYVGDRRNHLLRRISPDGTIDTIAGGASPDKDVGENARLNTPYGLAADPDGNLIIADREASRVLRLNRQSGEVTVVAGTGQRGFSGDGSVGSDADLDLPADVVVDEAGNIYIADAGNGRVRKIDLTGVISTFAGGGTSNAEGQPANMADLGSVSALAFDLDGNLYLTESNKVRKISTAGIITTVAGTGQAGTTGELGLAIEAEINNPNGLAFDFLGRMYISEFGGHVIRRVSTDGFIERYAGNGSSGSCGDGLEAHFACLDEPGRMAFGSDGALYIADQGNNLIRRIDFETRVISRVTTGGCCLSSPRVEAKDAKLYNPRGFAPMPDGSLIFSQTSDGLIRRLSR
jgi:sugar lactone lactonase YvrE